MEKSKLINFINRYYLAGNCESVKVRSVATGVECDLIDSDQTVVGKIQWKTDPFVEGELGINHTNSLTKMLSALGENIDIDVMQTAGKNYALKISEGNTKALFMLADTAVIPAVPTINAEPDYDVEISTDDEFVTKFIKAKNALPDARNFAVQIKNGKIKIIVNYSTVNSDNISFEIPGTGSDIEPICFSAEKLKEILIANKGDAGKMHVSTQGLSRIEFTGQDFNSTYWLVQLQN